MFTTRILSLVAIAGISILLVIPVAGTGSAAEGTGLAPEGTGTAGEGSGTAGEGSGTAGEGPGQGPSCTASPDCAIGEVCRQGHCVAVCQDRVLPTISIEVDRSIPPSSSGPLLDQAAMCMEAWRQDRIRLEGHTDLRGSRDYNLALSDRMASAVKDALVELGVDPARLETIAYGEDRPVCSQISEGCAALNRRVELSWR